ncbi:calmodulin-regulated spectrin-associated protein 3 [Aplochiton taeniatus]
MGDASEMKKTFPVPEIRPLDQYDFNRAKVCASVRWVLAKSYGSAENVPAELREPLYRDQYNQEHLKPGVSRLLVSPELYCRAQALLAQAHRVSQPPTQGPPADNSALLQLLTKKGLAPRDQDADITEEDLLHTPIKTRAHLALIDALMSMAATETVDRVKMAPEAEQMGAGSPWENALLFWVNRLNQKLRENTEEEGAANSQTCTDLQPAEPACSNRWYWKLVPHAIAFCLKESGNKPPVIRYRKDKVLSKLTPTFPLVCGVKDLSNGCAIAAVLHYYCPSLLPLEDVCLKDTMSVADSVYNLQRIRDFCENSLKSCCPLAVEDLLYAPPVLHVNIMSFIAELLEWFEVERPDFVQPIQPLDLTDSTGLLDCTSPVSGNSNSGSPSFIFKQPFVPISSPVSPEGKPWTKKQIGRPLSAVTFSIPFGLDSDVDIVMGNPVGAVLRSVSRDSLTAGVPALTHVPYSPPEDLSHLVSSSAPAQRSTWGAPGPHSHAPPLGELPTIEEALQVPHAPGKGGKDSRKANKTGGKEERGGGRQGGGGRPEPRLRPEGAPAGFFLHSPGEDLAQLSSSAPGRSGMLYRPVGGEAAEGAKRRGGDRGRRTSDMSRDDDSVLRDGSVDSSEASDDLPRNAPGNMRPATGRQGNPNSNGSNSSSPRMTSFAERRDNRKRGEESAATTPTPSTPGTPHTPSTAAGALGHQGSPGHRGPEPGTEAWELGVRLEEKRRSIEAQKRRIEAIFTKHRQRLGKTAFLQLKKEGGGKGGEAGGEDNVPLEERLTRMEEQLRQEEEKEAREKDGEGKRGGKEQQPPDEGPAGPPPPRLEKQVTFSVETRKGAASEGGPGEEKGGEAALLEANEVVLKLSEALRSLQSDMQKLTEQQQQLMSRERTAPRSTPKATAKSAAKCNPRTPPRTPAKTPPRTPTKTPPRTPTKTPNRGATKAWVIPAVAPPSSTASPSQRAHVRPSTPPKTLMSSSCPAPRTKIHSSSSTPRSPKHPPRATHNPRPSDLKFPPLTRALNPTQNVDTIPHLRRVSPSQCRVQTSSTFRIGGPRTPQDPPQAALAAQPEESASETGSSETPTQFSLELELELELEQEDAAGGAVLPLLTQPRRSRQGAAGGSSSGAPSECSFESETLSLSAALQRCGLMEASMSSLGGPEGGSDEPTDEGQEFSSDSMSDHMEPAVESAGKLGRGRLEPTEQLALSAAPQGSSEGAAEPSKEQTDQTEPTRPVQEQTEPTRPVQEQTEPMRTTQEQTEPMRTTQERTEADARGGIGFFFKAEERGEEEMAQRRALLLERQHKRTEEMRRRRQWQEQERESRAPSSEERQGALSHTPPPGPSSPSPTPPATPSRRGDFTRGEYARRHQLRIMADLDKVLRQKPAHQGQAGVKKTRPRPRSMTREESQLSRSPAKGTMASKLTKVYSHSSLNLAAMEDEPGNKAIDPNKILPGQPNSPSRPTSPCRPEEKDVEDGIDSALPSSLPEYTGPKLFKEPSFKSNKFIIHNALSRCCLAGKVNETQKNKIVEEMEKSPANHFLVLFRDVSCQFRGVYTMNPDSQELTRLAGVGPKTVSPAQVESIYKYSSDRKQFSAIPSKTIGMSVDAFTIPSHLWHGGGGGTGGATRRASITKKAGTPK